MALAVSVHYTDRIRCAVDVVGISNFNTFLKNTESYRRDLRRVEYGDERDPEMYEFLEKISPLNNAGKIRNPILIVQGSNDPRVPRTEAEQMKDRIMQSENRFFDDLAKMVNGIAGTVAGAGREAETAMRERAKEFVGRMDFVSREEFEAVKEMAAKARAEADTLKARLDKLEAAAKPAAAAKAPAKPRAAPKK